ncbi:hypothetical protein [Belnapia mucosa]|nr:hypothetical protein [Belnapia mucosa]
MRAQAGEDHRKRRQLADLLGEELLDETADQLLHSLAARGG